VFGVFGAFLSEGGMILSMEICSKKLFSAL
jgi:hypothetical protein